MNNNNLPKPKRKYNRRKPLPKTLDEPQDTKQKEFKINMFNSVEQKAKVYESSDESDNNNDEFSDSESLNERKNLKSNN